MRNSYSKQICLESGVVSCCGPKKQPYKSSIVQWIFYFWSFKICRNILEKSENIGYLHILGVFLLFRSHLDLYHHANMSV